MITTNSICGQLTNYCALQIIPASAEHWMILNTKLQINNFGKKQQVCETIKHSSCANIRLS